MPSPRNHPLGGVIHTYQRYDPKSFPSPTAPPPDLASLGLEHMLRYGSMRHLTPEELARAVHLDISQIAGLGPSLDSLIAMLEERKRKILERYENQSVQREAADRYRAAAGQTTPPRHLRDDFDKAVAAEQITDLEKLWYASGDDASPFAAAMVSLIERLGDKYQVEELAANYAFTGREPMTVPKALEIKEELEAIDRLLEQLREAMKNAQVAVIDMDELARFAEQSDIDNLNQMAQQIQDYLREQAELQGLEEDAQTGQYRLTPQAYRIFQGKLLEEIFSSLEAARSGRHSGPIQGEGAVELPTTKPYEFGDSPANMDIPASFVNAMVREAAAASRTEGVGDARRTEGVEVSRRQGVEGACSERPPSVPLDTLTPRHLGTSQPARPPSVPLDTLTPRHLGTSRPSTSQPSTSQPSTSQPSTPQPRPIRLTPPDIEIHRTRNTPKCATAVLMDMSGSMRYEGQYVNVKRMSLALDGLIRREYPGDFLSFIELYTFAKPRHISEIAGLMPKPVTTHAPIVRLKADLSTEHISEFQIPPHFTNIQHGLSLARRQLALQDTPNRQVILLTDGLPTAHFEGPILYLLYPPDPRTEEATMREARLCAREGITINIFLLPNWWQSSEDISFAHKIAEQTRGRVFFTAGKDVDRYVLWDYVSHRRKIIG